MAFNPANIDKLAEALDGITWFDYRTTDTIATVETAGYFNNFSKFLDLYDKIWVVAGTTSSLYYVSAIATPTTIQGVSPAGTGVAASVTITRVGASGGTTTITTGTTTLDATNNGAIILCDASSGPITVAFAAWSSLPDGWTVRLIRVDSSTNTVTVNPNASETVDGRLTARLIHQYDAASVARDTVSGSFLTYAAKWERIVKAFSSTLTVANEIPLGADNFTLELWGAGGSGAGSNTTTSQRLGGGGAGAYCRVVVKTADQTSLTITRGTGGTGVSAAAGGTAGNTGTDTTVVGSVLGTITAAGGAGAPTSGAGGAGGTATGGDENINGGDGGLGSLGTTGLGIGGDSPKGGQGGRSNVGAIGNIPGGGGACSNHTASTSGQGRDGAIIMTV